MFNLGTKTVVLNSNANVTEANGVISIQDSELLQSQQLLLRQEDKGNFCCKNAVAGVYNHSVTPYDDTKTYDIVLGIRSERVLSNIFSDIDVWTFQSKAGSTNIGGAAAQIAGFNDQVVKFSATFNTTFQPGYEGVSIESIEIRDEHK
jgi:hypothetical protein